MICPNCKVEMKKQNSAILKHVPCFGAVKVWKCSKCKVEIGRDEEK